MLSFAKCCQPVPGDQIVGIITRGRGISVHRVDCPNTFGPTIDDEHKIAVEWDVAEGQTFPAGFVVRGDLTSGFLADVSRAIADEGVEVIGASMATEDGQVVARFSRGRRQPAPSEEAHTHPRGSEGRQGRRAQALGAQALERG